MASTALLTVAMVSSEEAKYVMTRTKITMMDVINANLKQAGFAQENQANV